MIFLALVFALVLALAWDGTDKLQTDDWFLGWRRRVTDWSLPTPVELALAVLGPALVAYLVLDVLGSVLFGLPWFAGAVALLLYSLGRGDFTSQMEQYRSQALSGNFEGAFLQEMSEAPARVEGEEPLSPADVHTLAQRYLLYEGCQRWFAVVLYFMLLGPVAALAYRLLHLYNDVPDTREPGRQLASRCLFVADWIPSRLLAATFVIAGDFVGSSDELLEGLQDSGQEAGLLLQSVAAAAVNSPPPPAGDFGPWAAAQNREFGDLLRRSAGTWLVLISLYVILL